MIDSNSVLTERNNNLTRQIFRNAHNWNIDFILSEQYYTSIDERFNFDYVMVARELRHQEVNRYFDDFFSNIETFHSAESFRQTFLQVTENYSFMVYDQWANQWRWFRSKGFRYLEFPDYLHFQLVIQKSPLWCRLSKDLKWLIKQRFYEE